MSLATNPTSVLELAIRDQNNHDFPDTNGDDPDVEFDGDRAGQGYRMHGKEKALVKIVNTLDAQVTVSLNGSTFDDKVMDEDTEDTAAITVAAGATGFITTTNPWAFIRAIAAAATAPTTGTLKLVFHTDRGGKA